MNVAPHTLPGTAAADLLRAVRFERPETVAAVCRLWDERAFDTAQIAVGLDLPEHRVLRILIARREREHLQRAPGLPAGSRASAADPSSFPALDRPLVLSVSPQLQGAS